MLLPSPSSMRAAATTPAEPADARVARFPAGGSLPRQKGGSASALLVSGPAQRSLALQPAWSLSRPRRPRYIGVLQAMSLPPSPAPIATGWSDSCRAGFAPARRRRLSTAHLQMKGGEGVLAVLAHYGREGLAGCRIARLELHDRPRSARSRPGPRRGARRLAAYSDLRPKKQLLLNQLSPVAYFSRYDPKGACTSVRSPPRTKNRAYPLYAYTH